MTRIVQLANFVTPTSGGLRTVLGHLASGYARAGHEVVQVVPGPRDQVADIPWGTRVELRAPEVPRTSYRVLTESRRVTAVLAALQPDRVEVHDRTTLRTVGPWARTMGVPSLAVSHERLDRWLRQWLSPRLPLDRFADRSNGALADCFDTVICTTAWAEQEFTRLGIENLRRVPLGVDLFGFTPGGASAGTSASLHLVLVSRLSKEKRPDLALGAAVELVRRGHRVRLSVAGDGPLRSSLQLRFAGGPMHWLGFLDGRERLADLLRSADVVLAPGPGETFGLSALEALACGTAVVGNIHSALPEVLGDAGRASASTPRSFADAVEALLLVDPAERRRRARARAEQFPWSATVEGFLRAHRLPLQGARPAAKVVALESPDQAQRVPAEV
jgi:alpha-1,6-mannosyltransferase